MTNKNKQKVQTKKKKVSSSKEQEKDFFSLFKKKKKEVQEVKVVERYSPTATLGLTDIQVEERKTNNLVNNTKVTGSKSYLSIFVKNLFTFFI